MDDTAREIGTNNCQSTIVRGTMAQRQLVPIGAVYPGVRCLQRFVDLENLVVVRAIVSDIGRADVDCIEQEWGEPRRIEGLYDAAPVPACRGEARPARPRQAHQDAEEEVGGEG